MTEEAKKPEANRYRKFGMRDKIAYAAGDFACTSSFALAGTFFTLFYTQYMGISTVTFAALLIVLKVWDAINDPIVGGMIDSSRKNYKNGKFKAYILRGSIGLLLGSALCFLPFQNASYAVKIVLCLVGYIVWDAAYTMANVPYGSMLSVISSDPGDRAQLSVWRQMGAILAGLPVTVILPVILYDENNELLGSRLFVVALILGVLGFLAFQFLLRNTVQRIPTPLPDENAPKFNYINSVKNFARNRAAMGATLVPVSMYLGSYGGATAMAVMFQSYFQNVAISGIVSFMSLLPIFIFMPFIRKIVQRWGKKESAAFGSLFSILACLLMIVIPIPPNGTGIAIFMGCMLLNGLGIGIAQCVGNAMMADAIDYNEWKNGVREEGTTYALHSFFRKLAQGIGPSIGLLLMVALGYNETLGAAQPFEVALNMRYLVAAVHFFSAILMWVGLRFIYNLDIKTTSEMELALGRGKDAASIKFDIETV